MFVCVCRVTSEQKNDVSANKFCCLFVRLLFPFIRKKKQKQSKFAKFVRLILLSGHFVDLSKSRRFKGRIFYLFVCSVNLAKEHMMLLLANILPQFAKRLSLYVCMFAGNPMCVCVFVVVSVCVNCLSVLGEGLHNTIRHLLGVGYDLLDRDAFATILSAHLDNRVQGPSVDMFKK